MKSELAFSSIGNGEGFADNRWSNREYASIVFPITKGAWQQLYTDGGVGML